jgi:hypothetical protein
MKAIEPAQLGKSGEVLDQLDRRGIVLPAHDPAHVTPEESLERRVHVVGLVRVLVMMPVMTGPPERALLNRQCAADRHQKLHRAAHLVGAMGEVPVVDAGDEEHARAVEAEAQQHVPARDARPDGRQRDQVNGQERKVAQPLDAFVCRALESLRHRLFTPPGARKTSTAGDSR